MIWGEDKSEHVNYIGMHACYQIEHGAQLIQLFDSWAGELNPVDNDAFAAPYQKMVLDIVSAHAHVLYSFFRE